MSAWLQGQRRWVPYLALEAWGKQSGQRSTVSFLDETFSHLKSELLDYRQQ